MDIIAIAVALKKAISQTKDIIASHFVAGTNIEITDNPDGTQTINASGEVSATDEVARQAISDHEADINNPHSVTKNQIGLGNVDNTSDADKPISTATQAALNSKQDTISDLAAIRSNASAGAGAAAKVTGIDETGNNYIELKSGRREYLSTTVPTGTIPIGSVGMGFDEGIWTYKSGTKVGEGVLTANLFDIAWYNNRTGITVENNTVTGAAERFFSSRVSLPSELYGKTVTWTVHFKRLDSQGTIRVQTADSGSGTDKYGNNVTGEGTSTVTFTATKTVRLFVNYGGSGTDTVELSNIMLNTGSTPLPYEPYDKQKILFYANGQPLTDYVIYGNTDSVGDATANEFTGNISQFDNQGGTGSTYKYFKLTGDYTMTVICKDNCTAPDGITFGLNADGGVITGGYTALVARRGIYTKGQVITGKTSDNGYQYIYIYESGTELNWIMEHFDIMLNKGNTALPYEPYGYKIPVICGGQTTNIYLDSPLGANDSIDYTISQTAIPTVDGANSLICNTTVQPSKVSLTYTGWHSDLDGLQTEITSTNKLSADVVDDTNSTNKFVTAADKTAWNGKQDAISDLSTIRSNATAGAGAAEVVTGIDETGNNYLEMKSGQREYLSATVPTGNIPTGSVGMGWADGTWTYKSGSNVSEGVPTANLTDIRNFVNSTTDTRDYFQARLFSGQVISNQKIDSTGRKNLSIVLPAGEHTLRLRHSGSNTDINIMTYSVVLTKETAFNCSFDVIGYNPSTVGGLVLDNIMLNEGSAPLTYEPYGAKKFPFYANGQNLTDYTIYGNDGGVGDEVTDSESAHYGEYDIPVICGNTTTHIYLASPLGANDSIDYTTSQVAIPTVDGLNSLICDTTVQPSKVSLTYTGWHSDDTIARKVTGITETGNDHIKMGNGITLYISATQPQNPSEGDLWIGG